MKMICPYCEKEITFSDADSMKFCPGCGKFLGEKQSSKQTVQERQCPVCCTSIEADDEFIQCPYCGMFYHKECWSVEHR